MIRKTRTARPGLMGSSIRRASNPSKKRPRATATPTRSRNITIGVTISSHTSVVVLCSCRSDRPKKCAVMGIETPSPSASNSVSRRSSPKIWNTSPFSGSSEAPMIRSQNIGASELPLNGLVFQIFGDDLRLTLLLALGLGVSIPITAHFFGRSLRQEHKTTTDVWLLIVTPIVMFLLLVGVAVARGRFFEGFEALRIELPISPGLAVLVFLIINVGLFFAAAILSYEAAHPNWKSYNTLRLRVRDARRTLER